jgi:hypothetical protein
MNIKGIILGSAALIALCMPAGFAQSASSQGSSATPAAKPESIKDRKRNQQDRIASGVQSGQLTAGETKKLETREAGLNKEESNMRKADDGHLTAADRAKLNQQQNHLSNQIATGKHNANTAHYGNNEVGQRRENQQDRIAQGIKSGQLTPSETAHIEKNEQGINKEVSGMRQANGGKLTPADKKAVNQQQNKESRQIYSKKHNGRKQS